MVRLWGNAKTFITILSNIFYMKTGGKSELTNISNIVWIPTAADCLLMLYDGVKVCTVFGFLSKAVFNSPNSMLHWGSCVPHNKQLDGSGAHTSKGAKTLNSWSMYTLRHQHGFKT